MSEFRRPLLRHTRAGRPRGQPRTTSTLARYLRSISSVVPTPTIELSGDHTLVENVSIGTAVGVLSVLNGTGTYVFTVLEDPDSKFTLNVDGVTLETSAALDFDADTEHSVIIEANPDVGDTIAEEFIITVTDDGIVAEDAIYGSGTTFGSWT